MRHEKEQSTPNLLFADRRRVGNVVGYTPERRLHSVSNSGGQNIRPLADCLVGDADGFSGGAEGTAQQFNGLGLEHASLNHSSRLLATIVTSLAKGNLVGAVSLATMVVIPLYKNRLIAALKDSGKDHQKRADIIWLAKETGVTPQAITKILLGQSNSLSAANNLKAARALQVDPDWLASGETPKAKRIWPFRTLTPEQWLKIPLMIRESVEAMLLNAPTVPNDPTVTPAYGRTAMGFAKAYSELRGRMRRVAKAEIDFILTAAKKGHKVSQSVVEPVALEDAQSKASSMSVKTARTKPP